MHISYKPLWHTLLERDMRKEDLRLAAGMTTNMAFFNQAINILQTLVVAIGAGLAVWGVINLLEGYGTDNPGAKSQGIKQFMAN